MKQKTFILLLFLLFTLFSANGQIGRRMTTFNPAVNGFMFVNTFEVEPINNIRMSGFCGGMTYAVLDYFNAHKHTPTQNFRPANGTPLYDYIWGRQRSSVLDNLDKWTELTINPFGWRSDEFFNWGLQVTGGGRLQELKSEIDAGRPVPLGLFKPGNGGFGPHHQVLAIGYDGGRYRGDLGAYKEELKIYVCDPNHPGETKILRPDPVNHIYYYEGGHDNTNEQWQTYFVNKNYHFSNPPVVANPSSADAALIHEIQLEIRTGNDDLRGGSDNVSVTLNFKSKPSQSYPNINHGARWIDNYTETVPITLTTPVAESELRSITFTTSFGGGSGGDNWNMDMVRVLYGGRELLSKAGSPLFRFTGDAKMYAINFPVTLTTTPSGSIVVGPDNKVHELLLEVGTGGDDLRGGNDNVNVTVNFKNGTSQTVNNINKSNNWGNNSVKYVTISLARFVPLDQLKNIVLKTTFGGGIGGDNWNMQYLRVTAKGGGINQEIYFDQRNPLVRFDGNNNPFTATFSY
ncbi:MAG: hypothetical protein JST17_04080 [Bacteroidetes bacterium]|nr:hypothetical protein [Bacteroidota bacterium]MBS1929587.1 hypothetical protein [Bacteroidota bacterium]